MSENTTKIQERICEPRCEEGVKIQRCNHCMATFDESLTKCPECEKDDALMYPVQGGRT